LQNYKTELDEFIKSIFNVIIYKKQKEHVSQLRMVLLRLVRVNHPQVNQSILKNTPILMNYLQNGKQVEKALTSVQKMMKNSPFLLENLLEKYLNMLTQTKNPLLLLLGLKFLRDHFNKNSLKTHAQSTLVREKLSSQVTMLLKNSRELKVSTSKNKSKKVYHTP
jgi:hypothetical protein